MTEKRVAVVTGANRGIGFEVCRQLVAKGVDVVLTSRDESKGKAAAEKLRAGPQSKSVDFHQLDVTDPKSVLKLASYIREKYGRLDILVNNAGVLPDADTEHAQVEDLKRAMDTNVYGPFLLCQAFLPLMKERGYGRIINISSGMGQLSEMGRGYPAYRISKTALNAVTRIFQAEVGEEADIKMNSVCPGWVKTDMGGVGAQLPVEKGADTIVWLATLEKGAPSGGFFRERESIEW